MSSLNGASCSFAKAASVDDHSDKDLKRRPAQIDCIFIRLLVIAHLAPISTAQIFHYLSWNIGVNRDQPPQRLKRAKMSCYRQFPPLLINTKKIEQGAAFNLVCQIGETIKPVSVTTVRGSKADKITDLNMARVSFSLVTFASKRTSMSRAFCSSCIPCRHDKKSRWMRWVPGFRFTCASHEPYNSPSIMFKGNHQYSQFETTISFDTNNGTQLSHMGSHITLLLII